MSRRQPAAAVILAAGASTRFGSPKQLAPFDGGTMLDAVVATAREAGLDPIIVVAPSGLALPGDVVRTSNDRPGDGLSRSLRLGLAGVPAGRAAVVLLADQPTVTAGHLARLLDARGPTSIVATVADGVAAPPVLLEPAAFRFVRRVRGDRGLRDVLRAAGATVATVPVIRHHPDVDEPSDLEALAETCPGCGGRYAPRLTDETHPDIGASAACWSAFGELLAREFGDPAFGRIHRHTVDVYTVQHPGADGRRDRQSVAIHLIGLCHWLEHGLDAQRIIAATQAVLRSGRPDWPWLEPPGDYEVTVRDVLTATGGQEHERLVRRWAQSVWDAWSAHHDLVRRWAAEALD